MFTIVRLGWVVGLAVLVSACGAPGEGLQSPGTGAEQSTTGEAQSMTPAVTKVAAAVQATPIQHVATEAPTAVVEVTATEALPAAIEANEATVAPRPTAVDMVPIETPAATVEVARTEAEMLPTQTPTVEAETTTEAVAQAQPNANPGPSKEQLHLLAGLNNYGPAPQLLNDVWLNSEPLAMADLRGKVVMVEFWTFG